MSLTKDCPIIMIEESVNYFNILSFYIRIEDIKPDISDEQALIKL